MEASYEIVDKLCAWQQDRSPEGGDGLPCGWVSGRHLSYKMSIHGYFWYMEGTSRRRRRSHSHCLTILRLTRVTSNIIYKSIISFIKMLNNAGDNESPCVTPLDVAKLSYIYN